MTDTIKSRRQLTLETLEKRDMMDAGLASALAAPLATVSVSQPETSSVQVLAGDHQATSNTASLGWVANRVQTHDSDFKPYAEEIAKIIEQKIVNGGWNRWFIGSAKLESYNYDWKTGTLQVVLRLEGAVIESGTMIITGKISYDGIRNTYFACSSVYARSDNRNEYVSFGSNLEDSVKPLLTYVIPGGPKLSSGQGAENGNGLIASANSPTPAGWMNQTNQGSPLCLVAQGAAQQAGQPSAAFLVGVAAQGAALHNAAVDAYFSSLGNNA